MPAARRDGRAHSWAGHVRQGKRHDTRSAEDPSTTKTGPVTAAPGPAEYTAVPPTTWRITPTQPSASHPARSSPQLGRGARGSSVSSKTTASVAAEPPAIAVSTTPPASIAATAAPRPTIEIADSCHVRGWSVSSTAAGSTTIRPNAKLTPSILKSSEEPYPSGPRISSSDDRTGSHTASSATAALHAPTADADRPSGMPAAPKAAITAAAIRRSAIGATTKTQG